MVICSEILFSYQYHTNYGWVIFEFVFNLLSH